MPMRLGTERPTFEGATGWIAGSHEEVENSTKGNLTLVHFWSVSCGICKQNMPKVHELRDTKAGLNVVAIHMPRYEADTNAEAVHEAIKQHNITEPCAIDNLHKLKDAFQNEHGYVPAYYLFDSEGKMRGFGAGEKGLNFIMPTLERLLKQAAEPVAA